jgi:hypothetical protein
MTPKEKAQRDEIRRKYPVAGDTQPSESAVEMLTRLEKKKADAGKSKPAG